METNYQKKTESGLSKGEVLQNIGKKMTQKDYRSKKEYDRKKFKQKLRWIILF